MRIPFKKTRRTEHVSSVKTPTTVKKKNNLIVATMMVRNEEDILAECIEHTLGQRVDHIILMDNASTDSSREIASRYKEITIIDEPSLVYDQGGWQTRMGKMALEMGATWVVPVDADEFWEGIINLLRVPANFGVVLADSLYHHDQTDLIEEPFKRSQMPCFFREHRDFGRFGIGRFAYRPFEDMELSMGCHCMNNLKLDIGALKELWLHHYPIRSYERYAKKIKVGVEALIRGGHLLGNGQHWRAAYQKLQNGTLKNEYDLRMIKLAERN
jgi:glycosyltransferase involved in cell wall biosynthesis